MKPLVLKDLGDYMPLGCRCISCNKCTILLIMERPVQVLGQGMDGKLQYCPLSFAVNPETALKISLKKKKTFQMSSVIK